MRGALPATGVICLLTGLGVMWLTVTSGYFYACRLSVESDLWSCWLILALPLGAGISSISLGGLLILRSAASLPLPVRIRALKQWVFFAAGSLVLSIIWIFTVWFALRLVGLSAAWNIPILVFAGTLVLLTAQWIRIFLRPTDGHAYSELNRDESE